MSAYVRRKAPLRHEEAQREQGDAMTLHEPMEGVVIVSDDSETYPDPMLIPEWTPLLKLQWLAGVVKARTGVVVKIATFDKPDEFGLTYRSTNTSTGIGSSSFDSTWGWLSAFSAGIEHAQRLAEEGP